MENNIFNTLVEKQMKTVEIRCKLAQFLKDNNLSICTNDESDFLKIYYDFYEDGEPVLLFSSNSKKSKSNIVDFECLVE